MMKTKMVETSLDDEDEEEVMVLAEMIRDEK